MGGGRKGGGGGAAMAAVGYRAQARHHLLGHLDNGLGFYRFSYVGSERAYVGVMAQEVQAVMPEGHVRAATATCGSSTTSSAWSFRPTNGGRRPARRTPPPRSGTDGPGRRGCHDHRISPDQSHLTLARLLTAALLAFVMTAHSPAVLQTWKRPSRPWRHAAKAHDRKGVPGCAGLDAADIVSSGDEVADKSDRDRVTRPTTPSRW